MISSTANSAISERDALPLCFPIASLKRLRLLEEQLEAPQDKSEVGSSTLSKKHALGNFICCSVCDVVCLM